ncbi:MAG: VCBS repeat-containing protein [Bacteroidota bacterium]
MKHPFALVLCLITFSVNAQLQFDQPVMPPGYGSPRGMVVGDFDGNGRQDVIVSQEPWSILRAFYSKGEHDYTIRNLDEVTLGGNNRITALPMVGDLNHDGKDDLVLHDASLQDMQVCLSNGQGFDVAHVPINVSPAGWSTSMLDFDHDGNLDFIFVGSGFPVQFYKGDGAGHFNISSLNVTPAFPGDYFEMQVADLNKDQQMDFVIYTTNVLKTYIKQPNGTYSVTQKDLPGKLLDYSKHNLVVTDLMGDSAPEIVTIFFVDDGSTVLKPRLNLFPNSGNGSFSTINDLTPNGLPVSCIAHGDFDHDGKEDLALGGYSEKDQLVILRNGGGGAFEKKVPSRPFSRSVQDVAFIDLDKTGMLELAVVDGNRVVEWNRVNVNDFNDWQIVDQNIFGAGVNDGVAYDMDNDGIVDLVGTANTTGTIAIWYGKGGLKYEEPIFIPITGGIMSVAAADFNKDGYGDLVYGGGYLGGNDPYDKTAVMLSTGPRTFAPRVIVDENQSWGIIVDDLDNDGDIDIYNQYAVIKNNGAGQFTSTSLSLPSYGITSTATGHFNNDNFTDLAVATNGGFYVYINNGSGGFPTYRQVELTKAIEKISAADVNNDGHTDILGATNTFVAPAYIPDYVVLKNTGDGEFTESHLPVGDLYYVSPLKAGDIDKDGNTDLITPYLNGRVRVFPGLPDGTFGDSETFPEIVGGALYIANQGTSSTLADLDNDSWLDYVQFSLAAVPIIIHRNISTPFELHEPTNLNVVAKEVEATITLTKGNGNGRIIVVRKANDAAGVPTNGVFYSASTTFGSGTAIAGNYVVMAADQNNVVVTGLTTQTDYVASAFEYEINNGTITYSPGGPVKSFRTGKVQTIHFHNVNGVVTAVASSQLPVDLSITSGTGVVAGASFTPSGIPGTTRLHAVQDGNSEYTNAEADTTFCVLPLKPTITKSNQPDVWTSSGDVGNQWYLNGQPIQSQTNQQLEPVEHGSYSVKVTIDGCENISDLVEITPRKEQEVPTGINDHIVVGDVIKLTSTSGLPVTVSTVTSNFSGSVTINNNEITTTKPGKITLRLSVEGNEEYKPLANVITQFCILPLKPTISVSGNQPNITLTSSSDDNNIWFVNDVAVLDAGDKTFKALAGTYSYTVRVSVDDCGTLSDPLIQVVRKTPTISFERPDPMVYGTPGSFVQAESSSGLPVTLSIVSGDGRIENGNTFVPTKPGNVILHAVQSDNAEWMPAEAQVSFCVRPPKPTITVARQQGSVSLISSSDENNFWTHNGESLSDHGPIISFSEPGTYKVVVDYDGCSSVASDPVNTGKSQVISFINTVQNVFGSGDNSVTAVASSGLPVQMKVITTETIDTGSEFVPTAPGSFVISATQAGNADYLPVQAQVTFCVYPPKPTITVSTDNPRY